MKNILIMLTLLTTSLNIAHAGYVADLEYHETRGGHTIATHSRANLANLLKQLEEKNRAVCNNPRANKNQSVIASGFVDAWTAETIVTEALNFNSRKIGDWLRNQRGGNRVVAYMETASYYGNVIYLDSAQCRGHKLIYKYATVDRMQAILIRDKGSKYGYYILTSFPMSSTLKK